MFARDRPPKSAQTVRYFAKVRKSCISAQHRPNAWAEVAPKRANLLPKLGVGAKCGPHGWSDPKSSKRPCSHVFSKFLLLMTLRLKQFSPWCVSVTDPKFHCEGYNLPSYLGNLTTHTPEIICTCIGLTVPWKHTCFSQLLHMVDE